MREYGKTYFTAVSKVMVIREKKDMHYFNYSCLQTSHVQAAHE
jgi:hypothetical protein